MDQKQLFQLQPGDKIHVNNEETKAMRLTIVTQYGTEISSTLHPGGSLGITVGTETATINVLDAEEGYDGLRIVR